MEFCLTGKSLKFSFIHLAVSLISPLPITSFTCLFFHLPIVYPSTHPTLHPPILLTLHPPIHPLSHSSNHPCIYPDIFLTIHPLIPQPIPDPSSHSSSRHPHPFIPHPSTHSSFHPSPHSFPHSSLRPSPCSSPHSSLHASIHPTYSYPFTEPIYQVVCA